MLRLKIAKIEKHQAQNVNRSWLKKSCYWISPRSHFCNDTVFPNCCSASEFEVLEELFCSADWVRLFHGMRDLSPHVTSCSTGVACSTESELDGLSVHRRTAHQSHVNMIAKWNPEPSTQDSESSDQNFGWRDARIWNAW
jgi:hypothetical protein